MGRLFSVRALRARLLVALGLGAMFAAPSVALAIPVTYTFSGTISNFFQFSSGGEPMPDGRSLDGLGFNPGSPFTGFATYDPDAVCDGAAVKSTGGCNTQPIWGISVGDVSFVVAPFYFDWETGDHEQTSPVGFYSGYVAVLPDISDDWKISGNGETYLEGTFFRLEIGISTPPWEESSFAQVYVLTGSGNYTSGPKAVPEPASLGLLSIGLAGLLISRRRRTA